MVKTIRPNGTELHVSYDAAGNITEKKDLGPEGEIINHYEYDHDKAGKVTKEESSRDTGGYDLQEAEMEYGEGNLLVSYNGQEVEYDPDGNMIHGPLDGQMEDYTYDSRNRLVQVGNQHYRYDAEDYRVAAVENGVETRYVNNPHAELSQLLLQEDEQGNRRYYIYGHGLIGHEEDGQYQTYHYDLRGSTTALTDESGQVTDRYDYGPYGELVESSGETQTPFLYNGRDGVMTEDNGLYYMRARYYNPEIKRFINRDVVPGDIFDGRSLNRYAYATGEPVLLVDPFGLAPEESPTSIADNMINIMNRIGLGMLLGLPAGEAEEDEAINDLLLQIGLSTGDTAIEQILKRNKVGYFRVAKPLTAIGIGINIYDDFQTYEGADRYYAAGISVLGGAAAVGAGIAAGSIAAASAPVWGAALIGIGASIGVSWAAGELKPYAVDYVGRAVDTVGSAAETVGDTVTGWFD